MRHITIFTIALLFALNGLSQEEVIGSWQGKMSSLHGKYLFNLDIKPDRKLGMNHLEGVAIHDRNGDREVIQLKGYIYSDNSIYLEDVLIPAESVQEGKTSSKLQFLFKYENGTLVLDGYWQEYQNIRKYRKGRLFLRKYSSKA